MSHRTYIACLDCRQGFVLGDGSYGTSTIGAKTLAEFDEYVGYPVELGERARAHRLYLTQHEGHRSFDWNSDTGYIDDEGALRLFYDDDLITEETKGIAWFDLGDDGAWRALGDRG